LFIAADKLLKYRF